jgi:hypothetical protein
MRFSYDGRFTDLAKIRCGCTSSGISKLKSDEYYPQA